MVTPTLKKEQHMKANSHPRLRQVSVAILLAALSQQVMAEEEVIPEYTFMDAIKTGKNLTSFRLRYEHVDQDGLQPGAFANGSANPTGARELDNANAVTLRSLIGWQTAPYHNWSFAAQITNVSKLKDDFNDGTNTVRTNGAIESTLPRWWIPTPRTLTSCLWTGLASKTPACVPGAKSSI
jgi:hypothetical protein